MPTAFLWNCFLLKQTAPQSQITNKNEIGSLLNSFHITRGICKYNGGGGGWVGGWSMRGEIGLKTAWGEMLTMRQRLEEGGGWRERERDRAEGSLTKTSWKEVITTSRIPPCPQIPKGQGETTPIYPTLTHKGLHHLLNTPPNPSNTINRFPLRCKEKDSLGGTTESKKFLTNTNLNWRPLWASKNPLQEEL